MIPIAHDEHELKVLRILTPFLDTHAALCCFETTTSLPHMWTALLAETIVAYVKQLVRREKVELSAYSQKERETLRVLCYTFDGMHRGSHFKDHCHDPEKLLSGAEFRHPDNKAFSVTFLRVMALVISDEILHVGFGGPDASAEFVLRKLYDLLVYRLVKRTDLNRSECLDNMLLTDTVKLLSGDFAHANEPFETGPEVITPNMLGTIPEDAYRVVVESSGDEFRNRAPAHSREPEHGTPSVRICAAGTRRHYVCGRALVQKRIRSASAALRSTDAGAPHARHAAPALAGVSSQ